MRDIIYIASNDLEYYWCAEKQMWKWIIFCNGLEFKGYTPVNVYKQIHRYYKVNIYSDLFLDMKRYLYLPTYLTTV